MRTASTFWRRSPLSASTSTLVFHRPDEINWVQIALKMALGLILFCNFLAPFAAIAQNLGTSPQFGQAVQGQQATTVEGTVLNIVNWSCNVIAPAPVVYFRLDAVLDDESPTFFLRPASLALEPANELGKFVSRKHPGLFCQGDCFRSPCWGGSG
jgi:hypothetical protein